MEKGTERHPCHGDFVPCRRAVTGRPTVVVVVAVAVAVAVVVGSSQF